MLTQRQIANQGPDLVEGSTGYSVSRQMQDRFLRRRGWRRFLSFVYVAVLTCYMIWRYTIINLDSLGLSIAYFAADCIGFILGLTAIYTTWHYRHRDPKPAPRGLSVDVLIPTYKEPLDIIRRTVMSARDIEYPHGTFILDDGKRDDVRALAAELGVNYICRPDNLHAKAGNLNYGLTVSRADFVMTLDADHIALPHALDAMLGFFDNDKVALVQTPQDYYNIDAFQYLNPRSRGGLWHDQSVFYNIAQPCADAVNAASCVGTGVVYRRSALDHIGGIPVETVTEDIHTSLKLHKAGFRTAYLNESVAYGVAASDLGEYYKTRHRWGHGNLHALRRENILFCKGLDWRQRLHYLSLGLIYLEGWQQLLLFTIPVVALLFGLQPMVITVFNVLVVLLFPFLSYILLQEIGCGFARYWANELFSMARWPVYLASTAGLFGKKIAFLSSSKNLQGRVAWKLMAPQLAVIGISLAALGYAFSTLMEKGFHTGPLADFFIAGFSGSEMGHIDFKAVMSEGYTVDLVAIAGFWASYSVLRGGLFIRKVLHDAQNTHDYFRFNIPLPAQLEDGKGTHACVTGISEDWLRLRDYRHDAEVGGTQELTVFMPAGPIRLKLRVDKITHDANGTVAEGALVWPAQALRDRLANGIYSVDWHREFLHRNAYFMTPSDTLLRLFGRAAPAQARRWNDAIVYGIRHSSQGSLMGVISSIDPKSQEASLVTFETLETGFEISGLSLSDKSMKNITFTVVGTEPLSSLVREGLDGARARRYRIRAVA